MVSVSQRRSAALAAFSVLLTLLLGFGLPALLNWIASLLGFPQTSVAQCIVLVYLGFVLYVAVPPLPRGSVQIEGKAVLITGCDSGIGHELAKHLHRQGFTVFAGCLLKEEGGEGAAELERMQSDRMKVVQLDVGSEEQVGRAAQFVRANLADPEKGLWGLVNNAGISTFGEVEFSSMETYRRVAEVNLWGTIRVTKAMLPLIRKSKGRVVNVACMYGRMGNAMRSSYCVSKYGVEAFSDCLRFEMKRWGVKVVVVEPGNFVAATTIVSRAAVDATAERLWSESGEEVRQDYGKVHFDQQVAAMRSYCGAGPRDVTPVLRDVADAVASLRPFTRYNPMEMHWWVRMQVMTHLPAAVADRLYF